MQTETQTPPTRRVPSHPLYENEGLSTKKTALIIVTVVGCIAILWPKVLYPIMFGSTAIKSNFKEQQRGPGGCCEVVLDREQFFNASVKTMAPLEFGPHLFRKQLNFYNGEMSIRQERPTHLHPESIYQAMRERGRAIPATPPVPNADRRTSPSNPPPRIVDGRPGPLPGMRPPMGAGSLHQPQTRGSSMGFIMPFYTIGIVIFFAYTIIKIIFKKRLPNGPYGPTPFNPQFRKEVFGHENGGHVEDLNGSKLVVTAIQGLIDAADEHLKLRENATSEQTKKPDENSTTNPVDDSKEHTSEPDNMKSISDDRADDASVDKSKDDQATKEKQDRRHREDSAERTVAVLGMEVTASCEGGQKWSGRPPTPIFPSHSEHSKHVDDHMPEPQSIYLEGSLGHESQILVSDSKTTEENVYDKDLTGSSEEPAVVLSSKMTLSLINRDAAQQNEKKNNNNKNEIESPLADDIEIIGHEEN